MNLMKILAPKKIFAIYFLSSSCGIIWLLFNAGNCDFGDRENNDYAFPQGKRHEHLSSDELLSWQRKLIFAERQLRRTFPNQAQYIPLFEDQDIMDIPVIYAVTPTYARPVQKAELTRLANTFLNVPYFHWIVVEDSANRTELVTNLLQRSGLRYTHLLQPTPLSYKMQPKDPSWLKPRGVLQRNVALQWLRDNIDFSTKKGVLYFADDDNTYSLQLFEEMRWTNKASVWPVGLVGNLRYEAPLVKNNKVTSWFTYFKPERQFAMDMAGFAINIRLLHEYPGALFKLEVERGTLETTFLSQMITVNDLEPKADNCNKVLVWHTRTETANLKNEDKFKQKGLRGSDPKVEV